MVTIVLAIILGLGFTWIASQNQTDVTLQFAGLVMTLPLYIIGAASFLLGVFVTSIFSIFDFSSESSKLAKRESELNNVSRTNQDLQRTVQKLETENANLREELHLTKTENKERAAQQRRDKIKGFFDKLLHPAHHSAPHLS